MADYITRAKTIVANIKSKDQILPGNAFLVDMAHAYVYAYRDRWETFISSSDNRITLNAGRETTVVSPENRDDPLDIGS
jgi:hypothetical protein